MVHIYQISGPEMKQEEVALNQIMPCVESGLVFRNEAGFTVGESRIAPNGAVPAHKGNQEGVFVVVSGSGTVYTEADDGQVLSWIDVKAGDFLHYMEPHFKHRYQAGPDGLAYVVIPVP